MGLVLKIPRFLAYASPDMPYKHGSSQLIASTIVEPCSKHKLCDLNVILTTIITLSLVDLHQALKMKCSLRCFSLGQEQQAYRLP